MQTSLLVLRAELQRYLGQVAGAEVAIEELSEHLRRRRCQLVSLQEASAAIRYQIATLQARRLLPEPAVASGKRLTQEGRLPDTQCQRLYTWERTLAGYRQVPLKLPECVELVHRVFSPFQDEPCRLSVPSVRDGRGRRRACYDRYANAIALPRWGRTKPVILHECAHGIINQLDPIAAGHGPEFTRVLITLLHEYAGVPLGETLASARQAGLRIATKRKEETPLPTSPGQGRYFLATLVTEDADPQDLG